MEIYQSKYTGDQIDELLDQISQGGESGPLVEECDNLPDNCNLPDQSNVNLGKVYTQKNCWGNNLLYFPFDSTDGFKYISVGSREFYIDISGGYDILPYTATVIDITNLDTDNIAKLIDYCNNSSDLIKENSKVILSTRYEHFILNLTLNSADQGAVFFGCTVSRCSYVDQHIQLKVGSDSVSLSLFEVASGD